MWKEARTFKNVYGFIVLDLQICIRKALHLIQWSPDIYSPAQRRRNFVGLEILVPRPSGALKNATADLQRRISLATARWELPYFHIQSLSSY